MWHALRHKSFLSLWVGRVVSQLGDTFLYVAALWLLQEHSPLYVGVAGAVIAIPQLLSLFGGALADKLGARKLMLSTDVLRAVFVAAIAVIMWRAPYLVAAVLLLALGVTSVGDALFAPAFQAILPEIVPEDVLAAGNGLMTAGGRVSMAIGQAAAGTALAALTPFAILLGDAGTYLVSAIGISLVAEAPRTAKASAKILSLEGIADGLVVAKQIGWVGRLLPAFVVLNLFFSAAFITLPIWVRRSLGGGPAEYGILLGLWSIGQVLGGIAVGLWRPARIWQAVATAATAQGVLLLLLAFVPIPVVAYLTFTLAAVANSISNSLKNAIMQQITPRAYRGRVFGIIGTLVSLGNPLGMMLGGVVLYYAPPYVLLVATGLSTLWLARLYWTIPEFRAAPSIQEVSA